MEINVEGFRGINEPFRMKIGGDPIFLFGDNGAGKTSLLQAIEWCMFGRFAYLPAEEYKYEDAIVNSFHHAGTAKVELTLKDDRGRTLKLVRSRKKGKSTTAGKNPVTLTLDGKELTGSDAEEELTRLFELTPEEYYARTHLHQEAVRDLLYGEVADRSAMIDKMLGLFRLRELIESLPISTVDREVKDIEGDMEDANEEKRTYERTLEHIKKDLQAVGEDLKKEGVPPEKADLVIFGQRFTTAHQALRELAQLTECKIREIDAPKTTEDAKRTPDMIGKELTRIEDKRTEAYGKMKTDLAELIRLRDEYRNGLEEQDKLKVDPSRLTDEKATVVAKLEELGKKEKGLKNLNAELSAEVRIAARRREEKKDIESRLQEIKGKHGDKKAIQGTTKEIEDNINKTNQSIDQMGLSSKLVSLGAQYFQTSDKDTCPICEASVSPTSVRASLEKRLKEQKEAKAIEELRAQLTKGEEQIRTLKAADRTLDELAAKLEGCAKELNDSKKKLTALGLDASHVTDEQQLESFIRLQEHASEEQQSKLGEEIHEAERRKIELESIERKLSVFLDVEKKLQQLTGSHSKVQELLTRIEPRKKELEDNANRMAELGQKATAIREAIALMKSIIGFLTKKDEVEKMEKIMLPGILKKIGTLEPKLKKMQDLGTAIGDIHRASISTQEKLMGATLGTLHKDINKMYSRLVPHPHFGKLELVPQEVRGKYVYRILAKSKDGKDQTYVQTRFSLAQMNIAAIALFLAIGRRVPMGFLVFDDPSQSLDLAHKKGLADVLSEVGAEQQILVATQDEELQKELRRTKQRTKAQIVQLESWTTSGTKAK